MRPIDADALIANCDIMVGDTTIGRRDYIMLHEIDSAPTIEPKRGEWIDKGWKGDWQFETDGRGNCWYEYECSECGYIKRGGKSNYCPNCGADMRKREDK